MIDEVQPTHCVESSQHPRKPSNIIILSPYGVLQSTCLFRCTSRPLRVCWIAIYIQKEQRHRMNYASVLTIRHKGTAAAKLQLRGSMDTPPLYHTSQRFYWSIFYHIQKSAVSEVTTAVLSLVPECRWALHAELCTAGANHTCGVCRHRHVAGRIKPRVTPSSPGIRCLFGSFFGSFLFSLFYF